VTLVGVNGEQVRPAGVEEDTVRPTLPLKPVSPVTVIVDVPELPAKIWAGDTAPAVTVKPTVPTWNVMAAVV
jgi:hypothetical protein